LHDLIKGKLHNNNQKYKSRVDQRIREVNFEIGDQVLAHLRKERFSEGKYNKLKMKNIGPCNILRKFVANAYEIEFPKDIGISPIFNVANLYPYRMDDTKGGGDREEIQWKRQMPIAKKPQI
jgi:hypothetical protein